MIEKPLPLGFDDPTAQDVIDAMRFVLISQKDPQEAYKLVKVLLEFAPETESSRGIDLLMRLLAEATLTVTTT